MSQMSTNSNGLSMSVLKKRFNEINLKRFSETNLDREGKKRVVKQT